MISQSTNDVKCHLDRPHDRFIFEKPASRADSALGMPALLSVPGDSVSFSQSPRSRPQLWGLVRARIVISPLVERDTA